MLFLYQAGQDSVVNRLKRILLIFCCITSVVAVLNTQAWALSLSFSPSTTLIGVDDSVGIDIVISGLENSNLGAFDFNVLYDDAILDFDYYLLGDELGDIGTGEAEDWSLGDLGGGEINLSELSWLSNFSSQPDSFTLGTLYFSGKGVGDTSLSFSDVILSDEWGDPLDPLTLEDATITVYPILTGDVDASGQVDLPDAILSLQVINAMTPATAVHKGADVNGDGNIGLEEAIFAIQVVSGTRPQPTE